MVENCRGEKADVNWNVGIIEKLKNCADDFILKNIFMSISHIEPASEFCKRVDLA